jgi:hypothetical protein
MHNFVASYRRESNVNLEFCREWFDPLFVDPICAGPEPLAYIQVVEKEILLWFIVIHPIPVQFDLFLIRGVPDERTKLQPIFRQPRLDWANRSR